MPEIFAFCLDILLYKDVNGKLTKKLYDKVEILIFKVKFTYLSKKKHRHLLIVFCLTAYLLCKAYNITTIP